MSLGLGELSPDLFDVAPLAEARKAAPEPPEPAVSLESPLPVPQLPEEIPLVDVLRADAETVSVDEAIDLSALLESLDRAHEEAPAEDSPVFDEFGSVELGDVDPEMALASTPPLPETVAETPAETLSADIPFDAMGLSGGMTDELSALTGADRPSRPVVNVAGIPDREYGVLTRDQSVDKDTLLKIIDGIKNL
jgi:hypothetical protein